MKHLVPAAAFAAGYFVALIGDPNTAAGPPPASAPAAVANTPGTPPANPAIDTRQECQDRFPSEAERSFAGPERRAREGMREARAEVPWLGAGDELIGFVEPAPNVRSV